MPRLPFRLAAFAVLVAAAAGLVGCNRGGGQKPAPPPPKVTVVRPVMYPVQSYYEYNGYLDTTQSVEIRARVKGILKKVYFQEGTEVRGPNPAAPTEDEQKGQRLYSIDDREFKTAVRKADAELAKATADIGNWKAQIDLARAELKRAERSAESSAGAQTDVDKAKATLDVNKAQLKAAEAGEAAAAAALNTANIQLGYTDIRAPIHGRISRTRVDEGNLVGQTEATLLTTIVRVDELYVYFDAPEVDLVAYQQARARQPLPDPTSGQIDVEVGVAAEEGYPHRGKIDFRENRVDTGTGTVRIRGRIPNPAVSPSHTRLLYPGLYARVRVPNGLPQLRPAIPEDALMTGQEGKYVFVVGADNKVSKRVVTVGPPVYRAPPPVENKPAEWVLNNPAPPPPADPAKAPPGPPAPPAPARVPVKSVVAIEKGLEPGDRIIVDGLQKTRPGGEVNPDTWEFKGPPAPPTGAPPFPGPADQK